MHTNDLYKNIGGRRFKNIRTGGEGEVDEDKCNKVFVIDARATFFINEYPLIEVLINKIDLKLEK